MKIYTKIGDNGYTDLFFDKHIKKNDLRIVACNILDKINSMIGLLLTLSPVKEIDKYEIYKIMNDLFSMGTEFSALSNCTLSSKIKISKKLINNNRILEIEDFIDNKEMILPNIKRFILPIGCESSSRCHLIRVEIRQAEQIIISLKEIYKSLRSEILVYMNRLSDLFFVLARYYNLSSKITEVFW